MTGHLIRRVIDRPDRDTVAGLGEVGVATAHEAAGRRGLLSPWIRPIQQDVTIAGPAVTVQCHPGDNLMIHAAVEMCQPGDVLVVTTSSPSTDGLFGELLATSVRAHGVIGLITDAGVRDVKALREMGFAVWSRAVSAQGTVKASPGSVNVPVVCGGELVAPGDVVVADDDGVARVGREEADDVLRHARERVVREERTRLKLRDGVLGVDMYGLRELIDKLGITYTDEQPTR